MSRSFRALRLLSSSLSVCLLEFIGFFTNLLLFAMPNEGKKDAIGDSHPSEKLQAKFSKIMRLQPDPRTPLCEALNRARYNPQLNATQLWHEAWSL